jgi:hypothetical protein
VTATLVVLEKNADQNFGSHEFKNCCHLQHIVTSTHADMHVNNHCRPRRVQVGGNK